MIGKRIGNYQILEEIGRGGMAVVYKAWQPSLQRHVALKVLPLQFTFDRKFVERFRREALAAARLQHPNIVAIHDVGEQDGIYYIAMALVQGRPLTQVLEEEGLLSLERANRIVQQVAAALDYAHDNGFVHRDIKPSNMLVSTGDLVTLTDFGLVKAVAGTSLTQTGMMMGTPAYMSPEQVRGQDVGPAADIYALGIVLYQMLTGRVPFGGETPAVLHAQAYETPPPMRTSNAALPAGIEEVLGKALAKDPEARYATAGQLAQALSTLGDGHAPDATGAEKPGRVATPVTPPEPEGPMPADEPRVRRFAWIWATAALAAVVLVAAVILVTRDGRGNTTEPPASPPTVDAGATAQTLARRWVEETAEAVPTNTPQPAAVTPAPSATPLAPTATSSPTATPPLPTHTVEPSATVPAPTVTSTRRLPTSTSTPRWFRAPELLGPADGQRFSGRGDRALLSWTDVGRLGPDEYYVVTIPHGHGVEYGWTKETTWQVPVYLYDLAPASRQLEWRVRVERFTGAGTPEPRAGGEAAGEFSKTRSFWWDITMFDSPIPLP